MASAAVLPSSFGQFGDPMQKKLEVYKTLQNTWAESHAGVGDSPTDGQIQSWLQNKPSIISVQRAYMQENRVLDLPSKTINAIIMNRLLSDMLILAPLNMTDDEEYRFAWDDPLLPLFEQVAELAVPMVTSSERGESRTTRKHYKAAAEIEANFADNPVFGEQAMAEKIDVMIAGLTLTINVLIIQRLIIAGSEGYEEIYRRRIDNPNMFANLLKLEKKSFMAGSGDLGKLQDMIIAAVRVNPMIDTIILPPNCHIMHSQLNSPEVKVSTNVNVGGQQMEISRTLNREQVSSMMVNNRQITIISIPQYNLSRYRQVPDQTLTELFEASLFIGKGSDHSDATGSISVRDMRGGGSHGRRVFTPADSARDCFLLFGSDGKPAKTLHEYAHKLSREGVIAKDMYSGDARGKSVNQADEHAYENLDTCSFPYLTYNPALEQWFVPYLIGDFMTATISTQVVATAAEKVAAKWKEEIPDIDNQLSELLKFAIKCNTQKPTQEYLNVVLAWAGDKNNQRVADAARAKYAGVEAILECKQDSATGGMAIPELFKKSAVGKFGGMDYPSGYGTLPNMVYLASLPAEGPFKSAITEIKGIMKTIGGAFTNSVKQYIGEGLLFDAAETPEWMGAHAHPLSRFVEVLLQMATGKTLMGAVFAVTDANAAPTGDSAMATGSPTYTDATLANAIKSGVTDLQIYKGRVTLLNQIIELLKAEDSTGPAEMDVLFTNISAKLANSKSKLIEKLDGQSLPTIAKAIRNAATAKTEVIPIFSGAESDGYLAVDEGYKASSAAQNKAEIVVRLALRGSNAWFKGDTGKKFRAGNPASHYTSYVTATDTAALQNALFATNGLAAISPARMGLEAHRGDISILNLKTKPTRSLHDHMNMTDHAAGFVGPFQARKDYALNLSGQTAVLAAYVLITYAYNEVGTFVALHRAGAWLLNVGYLAHKQHMVTQQGFAMARANRPLVTCMSPVAVRPGEDNVVGKRTIAAEFYMAVCPAGPPGDILRLPDICAVQATHGFSAGVARDAASADMENTRGGDLLSLPMPIGMEHPEVGSLYSGADRNSTSPWAGYLRHIFSRDPQFDIGRGSVRHITAYGVGEDTNGTGRYGHSTYSSKEGMVIMGAQ